MLTRLYITQVNWARGETGWSGLHYAAWCNYPDLTDLLLSQPCVDLNIQADTCTDQKLSGSLPTIDNEVRCLICNWAVSGW